MPPVLRFFAVMLVLTLVARGTANATYLIAWDVGIGAAVLLGGLIAEISSFDDAFILGLIMLFFSAVLYMKVIGPQYEKNRLR